MTAASHNSIAPLLPPGIDPAATDDGMLRYWKTRLGASALGLTAGWTPIGDEGFAVFNYHRVHPQVGLPLSLTPEAFERQLRGLLARGYRGVTVVDYVNMIDAGKPVDRKLFAITFDDAFDNVRQFALPILNKLGLRASVYLATEYVGQQEFPFDPLIYGRSSNASADVCRPLDLDGVLELADSGWELAAHTHSHRDFSGRPKEFAADMHQSLEWMSETLGIDHPTFSFPYGGNDASLREVCRELPIRCALTTESELIVGDCDRYAWGRFGAEEYDTGASLAARAGGWYTAARRGWRRLAYGEPMSEKSSANARQALQEAAS